MLTDRDILEQCRDSLMLGRSRGVGIFVACQIPSKVGQDILAPKCDKPGGVKTGDVPGPVKFAKPGGALSHG